jgi:hypothetical protein
VTAAGGQQKRFEATPTHFKRPSFFLIIKWEEKPFLVYPFPEAKGNVK